MNNKIWSWTDKQRRKKFSKGGRYHSNPSKWYFRAYWSANRERNKKALLKELNGEDGDFSFGTERNQAQWNWW